MLKTITVLALAFLGALSALAFTCPATEYCPIHQQWLASFVGNRIVDGVFVGVYHCPYGTSGHNFIERCN
jgi:hypothetical protein